MQEKAIKQTERYGKIALTTNIESCRSVAGAVVAVGRRPRHQIAKNIGYDFKDLGSIAESFILDNDDDRGGSCKSNKIAERNTK